ncbi:DUF6233 domain-containing protein (plasmid) [Streptomyces sp. NBC_00080]|uniref:DUF6233 domain-containing protein n=1 Tax=Streptomyces sp. NBC_00080 TaxID=2975645 RepID=UPI0032451B28
MVPSADAAERWAWKVEEDPAGAGHPDSVVVHGWHCQEALVDGDELGLFDALEIMQRPGAVACSECGADVALRPLA